jgi:hypothetical protein
MEEDRDELLNEVFSYIESGNAGMDDSLYDMKKPDEWKKFALPIKLNNTNRPAFQDEFARVIPDWKSL